MPAGFRRHLVGKTLINVFHCDINENTLWRQANDHTEIFMNQRIECYLNITINLRHLTLQLCYVIPTKWRLYCGHRFCDVTTLCIFCETSTVY